MRNLLLLSVLLFLHFLCFAQEISVFKKIENEAIINPAQVLEKLKIGNFESLSYLENRYIFVMANKQFGEYKLVDSCINEVLANRNFENDSALFAKFLIAQSNQQKITEQFEKAVSTNRFLEGFYRRRNDSIGLVKNRVDLAEIYRTTENFNLGISTLNNALSLINNFDSVEYKRVIAQVYNRKAAIYNELNTSPDSVIHYSNLAIKLAKEANDLDLLATSYNELGYLYINLKPNDPDPVAKLNFERAIELWDSTGHRTNRFYAQLNLSRYYNRKSQYQSGINLLLKLLPKVSSSKLNWEKGSYYQMLSRLYGGLKQYERGYFYGDLARELLLAAQRSKYNERLALSNMQFELKKKEFELKNKQTEIMQASAQAEARETENTILYIVLIGLLLIGIVLIVFWVKSSQLSRKLKKQKGQIIEINEELTTTIDQKESLLREVNHRVKNNLSVLSSLLYLQQKKVVNPEVKLAIKDSLIRINTISLIHESLYQRDDMSKVDFQEYLDKLINYNKSIYWDKKQLNVEIQCNGLSPDLSNSVPLAMIINELVTNSFKYAFNSVTVPKISVSYKNNVLKYSDNGPGIKSDELSDTLGLKLVNIFSKQLNAKVAKFTDQEGFHYQIQLPQF